MLESFSFYRTPSILFGIDSILKLGRISSKWGKKLLLVTGRNSFDNSSYREKIETLFSEQSISYERVSVSTEPTDQFIDDVCGRFRNAGITTVVAIGGGSVLDSGKAISAILPVKGSIRDYIEGIATSTHPGTKVPFVAVPTTSGTGSEASANAVITVSGSQEMKRSVRHTSFVPDVAIVDPQLTTSCPKGVTSACGMDTLTQLIESYVSTSASPITDSLVEKALPLIEPNLINAVRDGSDLNARSAMAYASLISGITLANAGLGAVHGIAPVVGARHSVPHGVACGLLLGPVTEITIDSLEKKNAEHPVLQKYSHTAELLLSKQAASTKDGCGMLIAYLEKLTSELQIPAFSEFGVSTADVESLSKDSNSKKNPVTLNDQQIAGILMQRI
ncbi:MAG: iron-containing alcohol dehydrogenase [Fibrobacterota bacterium]